MRPTTSLLKTSAGGNLSLRSECCSVERGAHSIMSHGWATLALLLLVLSSSFMSSCGSQREQPFSTEPSPDIEVTTLEQPDIDAVANVIQFQGTILMGADLAARQTVSVPISNLLEAVREQSLSRGRDLDALVRLKNAPAPTSLGRQNSEFIDALGQTDNRAWDPAIVSFFRTIHTNGLRLMRDMADRSQDPDVRAFAQRQLSGIVATLHHLDQLAEHAP